MWYNHYINIVCCDEESIVEHLFAESRRRWDDGNGIYEKNTSELAEESRRSSGIRTARSSRKDVIKRAANGSQFGWYRGRMTFRPIFGAKGLLFCSGMYKPN